MFRWFIGSLARPRFVPIVVVCSLAAAFLVFVSAGAPTAVASQVSSTAATVAAAQGLADSQGSPVEALDERTEYTQLFAEPGGVMMQQTAASPVFGRDASGELVPVDTTLVVGASGIAPVATAVSTVLPTAGSGKSLSLSADGASWSLGLPGTLPTPTLDGSTATYANVYPDVDLQLTATADGVREIYVVKTPQAASDAGLQQLTFGVHAGSGRLLSAPDGGFDLVNAAGSTVMSADQAVMWDSASTTDDGSSAAGPDMPTTPAAGPADAGAPALGDTVAPMKETVSGHQLTVKPIASMFSDAGTVYPVYVDPALNLTKEQRLHIGSAVIGSDWQFTGDAGVGRCPVAYDSSCKADHVERVFYSYARGNLRSGDDVLKAEFSAHEDWSANCTAHKVNLDQTGAISSSTKWPGPAVTQVVQTVSAANGYSSSCPAADVEFSNAKLATIAQKLANGVARVTLSLRATDETDQLAWKRFTADNATFRVWYVEKPALLSAVGYAGTGTSGVQCSKDASDPTNADTYTPKFGATVSVQTQASGAPVPDLKARFEVQQKPAGGSWAETWSPTTTRDTSAWVGNQIRVNYTPPAADALPTTSGMEFRVRGRGLSHYEDVPDVADGTILGSWGAWCYFTVDPDAPAAPVVTITGTTPTDQACATAIAAGETCQDPGAEPLSFSFAPNPNDNDANVDHYTAKLSPADLATLTQAATPGATATVTPQSPGQFTLEVVLYDTNKRWSATQEVVVDYAPKDSVADWDVTAADTSTAVANTGVSGAGGTLSLSGTAVLSAPDGGRSGNAHHDVNGMPTDKALTFDGAAGQAASTSAPVSTAASFSFAAWAWLSDASQDRTVLSEMSADGSTGLDVRFAASSDTWVAEWHYLSGTTASVATATAPGTPIVGAWESLIVSYDAEATTLTLYVNGNAGTPVLLTGAATPVAVAGPLVLGHAGAVSATSDTAEFDGRIDQVQAWDRPLAGGEAFGDAIHPTDNNQPYLSRVADWIPNADGTGMVDVSVFERRGLTLIGAAPTGAGDGTEVTLDGTDNGLEVAGPVVDGTAPFTVNVHFSPDIGAMAAAGSSVFRVAGQRGPDGGPDSSWALWFQRESDVGVTPVVGYFVFGSWSSPSALSEAGDPATNIVDHEATLDSEMDVTAAYRPADESEPNPNDMELAVFVDATPVGAATFNSPVQGSGTFDVGMADHSGTWSDWLPADVSEVTVMAGGADNDQVDQVSDWSDTGTWNN